MKCSVCGGDLVFQNGIASCLSCGTNHKIDHGYEDTEVYICCVENDAQGRRAKDSVIANDIYKKLEAKQINTFFERISASNFSGDVLEEVRYQAIYNAKVILVVGTSVENFSDLLEKYAKYFEDKKIIPVYSEIAPEQMPEEFSKLQALNYDGIGSDADLVKTVWNLLGKVDQVNLEGVRKKEQKKKKTIISIAIASVIALVVAILVIIGIVSNKNKEPVELTPQQKYENAQVLINEGKFVEAADLLREIIDHKDSKQLLNNIYNRYDGYYLNEDKTVQFHIDIQDGSKVALELSKKIDSKKINLSLTSEINANTFSASFIDSQSAKGTITISLTNDSIIVKTVMDSETSNSIGNGEYKFLISERSDNLDENNVTPEIINKWLTEITTKDDLINAGYEIEFVSGTNAGGGVGPVNTYKIAETDIYLLLCDMDFANVKSCNDVGESKYNGVIYGITAPAKLLIPDKIGSDAKAFVSENILYVPNSREFSSVPGPDDGFEYFPCFVDTEKKDTTINSQTSVGAISKKIVGEYNFNWFRFNEVEVPKWCDNTNSYYSCYSVLEDEENISKKNDLKCLGTDKYYVYYSFNKTTLDYKLLKNFDKSDSFDEREEWKNYPDVFKEFMPEETITETTTIVESSTTETTTVPTNNNESVGEDLN